MGTSRFRATFESDGTARTRDETVEHDIERLAASHHCDAKSDVEPPVGTGSRGSGTMSGEPVAHVTTARSRHASNSRPHLSCLSPSS